jgi:hypothetical protein
MGSVVNQMLLDQGDKPLPPVTFGSIGDAIGALCIIIIALGAVWLLLYTHAEDKKKNHNQDTANKLR